MEYGYLWTIEKMNKEYPEVRFTMIPEEHPLRNIRQLVDSVLADEFAELADRSDPDHSITPNRLIKATLLQPIYSIRTEHMLCERIRYNILFQWFLDLDPALSTWDPVVLRNERELLNRDLTISRFFQTSAIHDLLVDISHHDIFKPDTSIIRMYLEPDEVDPKPPDKKQQPQNKKLRALDEWIWGGRH
jgi:hypothetical protein